MLYLLVFCVGVAASRAVQAIEKRLAAEVPPQPDCTYAIADHIDMCSAAQAK